MKRFRLAIVAAAAALVSPGIAHAEDKLAYDDLITCAAFNKVVGGVLESGSDATKNKDQADVFNQQSVALMTVAAVGANKTADQVFADMTKQSTIVLTAMADKTTGTDYIGKNFPKCNTMGKAALSVLEETKKTK